MGSSKTEVLLVDDDPHILDFISEILKAEGFVCHRASSGAEVLSLVRAHPISLMILDLLMPKMDGWQVLEQMQTADIGREIPIIVVSAVPSDTSRDRVLELGATGYISKPFSVAEFQAAVDQALQRQSG